MTHQVDTTLLADLKPIDGRTPEGMCRLVFRKELEKIIPVPAETRSRWQEAGTFPRPIPMGNKRGVNRVAWLGPEIEQWISQRIAERDGVTT